MKKAAKKVWKTIGISLLAIILHPLAVVSLIASVPCIIVDKILGAGREKLQVTTTLDDGSSKEIYIRDYLISITCYLFLSLFLLSAASIIVQKALAPDILSNFQIIRSFLVHVHLPQSVSGLYKDMYSSGLLYTMILLGIGALIELLSQKLSFIPKILQDSPYEVLPMEKCVVLLYDLLILVPFFISIFGERSLSFSILSVFVGYFFWIKPDKGETASKLKELLKVRKPLYYFLAMLSIYLFPVLILSVTSAELSFLLGCLLGFGFIMHFITWDKAWSGLSDIRRECKRRWKMVGKDTMAFLISLAKKIGTGISNAKSAVTEAISSMSNTIRFRVNIRKKNRIKEKAVSRQDNDND
jgi:hypothetical protein